MNMNKIAIPIFIQGAAFLSLCGLAAASGAGQAVKPVEQELLASQVHNLGGFFGERWQASKEGSLKDFDIERFVRMVEEKKKTDWFWIGEQPGKWLESSVLSSAGGKDTALESKAREMLLRMVKSQEAGGYLGITSPEIRTNEKPLRGMDPYEQYFTFHALLTAYEEWGDRAALDAAIKLGDYYLDHIGPGKAEFWPSPYRPPENTKSLVCPQSAWAPKDAVKPEKQYKHSEIAGHTAHYGFEGTLVIDPILRLYQATGEKRFLDWAKWVTSRMDTWSGWNSFSKLDDVAAGKIGIHEIQPYVHSHTFQMNFLGFLRMYQITGDKSYLNKVEGAWKDITERQMFITGGVSVGEHFAPGYERPLDGRVVETCANMSWMQLNQALLELTGDTRYADVEERLLLNHVFAAQEVDGASYRYHTPPNGFKPVDYFHGPDCCTSSGPRLVALLPKFLYAESNGALLVNQYVASTAEFKLAGGAHVALTQETRYPEEETVTLKVDPDAPASFPLKLRMPGWCEKPEVSVNGVEQGGAKPGGYLTIERAWQKGDVVRLRFPMDAKWIQHDHLPADKARWAVMRGPVVYAVDTLWWDVNGVASPRDVARSLAVLPNAPLAQEPVPMAGVMGPGLRTEFESVQGVKVRPLLVPFANVGRWYRDPASKPDRNSKAYSYAVWLPAADSKEFAAMARNEAANALAFRSIDLVKIGDEAQESEHKLAGKETSTAGSFHGRAYRHGKEFGWTVKVSTESPTNLVVTYWGGDSGREFDILINDEKVATETLTAEKPGEFIEKCYAIPLAVVAGKTDALGQKVETVKVTFLSRNKKPAGGVFGLRTEQANPGEKHGSRPPEALTSKIRFL